MAKLDNYMVLDFDTIRPILKYISVYGCYTAKQIAEEFDITEYQYKENLLRVFYSLNKKYLQKNKSGKSNIISVQYDRYDNIANLLIKAFKMKSTNKSSIDAYLMLIQALSGEKEKDISQLFADVNGDNDFFSKQSLIQYLDTLQRIGFVANPSRESRDICRRIGKIETDYKIAEELSKAHKQYMKILNRVIEKFDKWNVKKDDPKYSRLNEAWEHKDMSPFFIKDYRKKTFKDSDELIYYTDIKCYKLQENILKSIYDENHHLLNELNSYLYCYRHILPMSSLGHMVQDSLREFVSCEYGDTLTNKDHFIFKDCFYWKMLEDEVLLHILYAKKMCTNVSFRYIGKDNNAEIVTGIPYKVLINDYDNRQYLFLKEAESLKVYRLDMIFGIVLYSGKDMEDNTEARILKEYPIELCRTGYLDYKAENPFETVEIVVDFYFDENDNYKKHRMKQEKSNGIIEELDDNHYVYTARIIPAQLSALVPWLRTFGASAVVRKSEQHELYDLLKDSYERMMSNYAED